MKNLNHPNIILLYEIINDPESENLYLGNKFIKINLRKND